MSTDPTNQTTDRRVERTNRTTPRRAPLKPGDVFGSLTLQSFVRRPNGNKEWFCQCKCGAQVKVQQSNLLAGRTASCGYHRARKDGRPSISRRTLYRVNGKAMTLLEWSRHLDVGIETLRGRIATGMSPDRALVRGPLLRTPHFPHQATIHEENI